MTPFLNPANNGEMKYNGAHTKTRRVIECAFGKLKSRFRCLDRSGGELQFSPERCSNIIMACSVLHNIAVIRKLDLFEENLNNTECNIDINIDNADNCANNVRTEFVNHFNNM